MCRQSASGHRKRRRYAPLFPSTCIRPATVYSVHHPAIGWVWGLSCCSASSFFLVLALALLVLALVLAVVLLLLLLLLGLQNGVQC
eukprot:COSAG05_NODE_1081_length_5940_cov_4.264852_13_plen_86_part_00